MKSPIDLPRGRDVKNDLIAGLTTGLVQIPDAMATAILAAVQPVNGLNTLVVGTPIGALFAGSVFMTVTTTGAIALAVADAVGKVGADERTGLLIMLTLMVGVIQLAFGLLKLGWITKFVSNSVMVGFITGVCILIILGQLGDLTGYSSEYSNKVVKTVDLVLHFDEVSWTTLAVGLVTVGLILAARANAGAQVRHGAGVRRRDHRSRRARARRAAGQRRRRHPVGAARSSRSPTSRRPRGSSSRRSRSPRSA